MSWQISFNTCAFTWWEHLIFTLVPFLLGLLLGYLLWYRYRQRIDALQEQVDKLRREMRESTERTSAEDALASDLQSKIDRLESELSSSRMAFTSLQNKYNTLSTAAPAPRPVTAKPVAPASTKPVVVPRTGTKDNLTKIEGIGPKTQAVLYDKSMTTYQSLADSTPRKIKAMLEDAGPHFRILDPGTWPKQAKMAAAGKWDDLRTYQDYLIGGRDPKAIRKSMPDPDLSKTAEIFGRKVKLDDLKLIEGIGPKIEKLLKKDGIDSWWLLSEAKVSRIQKVLDAAGSRYRLADPGTWPRQARMAARGEWKKLKSYQDKLDGGKA